MVLIFTFANEDDKTKFEYIYTTYKKLLLYKSYQILKDYRLAEDAASEAFIKIYRNLHKIDDPASNKAVAFLVTITKNTALTMLKKEMRNNIEEIDDNEQDSFNLEDHIVAEMEASRIFHVLEGLNEELKSVFLLKYSYGLSHKEIGQLLMISENNVTVRLHRAKKKIGALLKKEGYVHER